MAVSLTRLLIRQAVLREIGEDTANPSFWSTDEVNRHIDIVINDFLKKTKIYVAFATSALSDTGSCNISIGEGNGEVSYSQFMRFYHGKNVLDVKLPHEVYQLKGKNWATAVSTAAGWSTFEIEFLVVTTTTLTTTGQTITFQTYPKPVSAWTGTNENLSYAYIPTVSLTADATSGHIPAMIPPEAHEAIVHGTIVRCLKKIWNPEPGEITKLALHQEAYNQYLNDYTDANFLAKLFVERPKQSGLLTGGGMQ